MHRAVPRRHAGTRRRKRSTRRPSCHRVRARRNRRGEVMGRLRVRLASEDDVESLVHLYGQAQAWLAQKGTDQWATNTPEQIRKRVVQSIREGECYVAYLTGQPIGMMTVDGFADPEFWMPEDLPSDALYVHRMVVDRFMAGMNVGGKLLDYAEAVAAERGKRWLRLDAWRTNASLHTYYLKQGFELVRTVSLDHRGSGALFQRCVAIEKNGTIL
ncbi:GNAT family N-acetyltransferase [Actinoplanes sp. CA-131856]